MQYVKKTNHTSYVHIFNLNHVRKCYHTSNELDCKLKRNCIAFHIEWYVHIQPVVVWATL